MKIKMNPLNEVSAKAIVKIDGDKIEKSVKFA